MCTDLVPLLRAAHHPREDPIEGATVEEIRGLQARLGFPIPETLIEWLRVCRGSAGGAGGIYGVGTGRQHLEIEYMLDLYPEWRSRSWIPIAGDGCGNYYVLLTDRPDAPVGFIETIDSEYKVKYIAATTLHTFLREMFLDEAEETGWPFDLDYVKRVDPGLLRLSPNPFDL